MASQNTPTTTTQIQKTELPPWVDAASQQNYADASTVADRPFQQYTGSTVAQQNDTQATALGLAGQAATTSQSALGQAIGTYGNLAGYQSQQIGTPTIRGDNPLAAGAAAIPMASGVADVAATPLTGAQIAQYANPYTDAVVNTTLTGMKQNLAGSYQAADDAARGQGAWGSSRSGVQQAVLQSQGAQAMASTEAGLRSTAYNTAASEAQTDNASALQAAMANQNSGLNTQAQNTTRLADNQNSTLTTQALNAQIADNNTKNYYTGQGQQINVAEANQSADLSAAGIRLGAAGGLTSAGTAAANAGNASSALYSALGQQQQQTDQNNLDASANLWNNAYNAPIDALNLKMAALGMSPYGKTTSGTSTTSGGTSSSPILQGLGGGVSLLGALFSDRDTKKNIRKLGPTGAPGINAYEYEYKAKMGAPKGQKHVGVMADEVKKAVPSALSRAKAADGKTYDAVDYGKVGRHIAKKRGFLAEAA